MKYLAFGEIMLRLKSVGQERLFQSPMLEATFGGSEANAAISMANYGLDVGFLSALPLNAVGQACAGELRRFGVDTSRILWKEGRMGVYYMEPGANQLPARVIYDRADSAMALTGPGDRLGSGLSGGKLVSHHRDHAGHIPAGPGTDIGGRPHGAAQGDHRVVRLQLPGRTVEIRLFRGICHAGADGQRQCTAGKRI